MSKDKFLFMKSRFIAFGLLLGFLLTNSCAGTKTEEFTIMSYNIRHGVGNDEELDLSRALAVIKAQSPDYVALQEIDQLAERSDSVNQTEFFANELKMNYTFGEFMPFQGGAYGMASLSAKEIKSTKLLSLPDGIYEPRISIVQEIEIAKGALVLLANVHFDWISGEEGEASRSAQAAALIEYLNQFELPTIITGDFNCQPESPTMQLFYEAGFEFADKGSDNLSFQGDNKVEIDHVIYRNTETAQLRVKFIDLLEEPLVSDHRPLVAHLELAY